MQELTVPINTQSPEELARLVKMIDPALTHVKDLHPASLQWRTLLVTQQTDSGEEPLKRILKIQAASSNIWDSTYFGYEIHALRRVKERNVPGVVRLVREYHTDHHHAILKSYAAGTPCDALDHDSLLRDEDFVRKLDALYLKLHLAGIARISYHPSKFIMGPDNELTLVDLGTCIVNTESGVQRFSQDMRRDSRFITRLEQKLKAAKQPA